LYHGLNTAPLVIVAVVNAYLGKGMGLHSHNLTHAVFTRAMDEYRLLPRADQDVPSFIRKLRDACYGIGAVHGTGPRKRFPGNDDILFKCANGRDCLTESRVSTVMTFGSLRACLSTADFRRLFWRGVNPDTGATDDTPRNRDNWLALQDPSPARRDARRFRLDVASLGLGNPVLWVAPTSGVEAALASVAREEWANTLRDRLGLYLPRFDQDGSKDARATNRRFVVHIPAVALTPPCHARPSFADAGGYPRFMVESAAASAPTAPVRDWGQTTDLGALAVGGMLRDGIPERVCRRLDAATLGSAELSFDYLGEITCERGNTPRDNDAKFATLLSGMLTALHPPLAAELAARGALEASLVPP
jgi:hypothetical protein